MKLTSKYALATAAIAGLLTGTAVKAQAAAASAKAGVQVSTFADKGTHTCKGQNACKGKGGCATDGSKK